MNIVVKFEVIQYILIASSINEVASRIEVRVHQFKCILLAACSHIPFVSNAHPAQLNRRDIYARIWGKAAIAPKFGLGRRYGCEYRHEAVGEAGRVTKAGRSTRHSQRRVLYALVRRAMSDGRMNMRHGD